MFFVAHPFRRIAALREPLARARARSIPKQRQQSLRTPESFSALSAIFRKTDLQMSPFRIANACAFWGDQPNAAAQLVAQEPDLDFLTLDYLAEVSLSIMAIMRAKDPGAGYAREFVDVVRSLAPFWRSGGKTRLVTNAGGLNPVACARACAEALRAENLPSLRIAIVLGDDVLPLFATAAGASRSGSPSTTDDYANLETGAPFSGVADRVVTANAYLGARPIADALRQAADIVITGRVADPSLTVGPCLAHFGWPDDAYDRIAGATVAGHLIECGTQVCGGCSTDWLELTRPHDIGFPIAELSEDGSCVVTKPSASGGAVTLHTIKEQLLYEIGDPSRYLSPDATVSFLSLNVDDPGRDRVRISGATGSPPPPTYKVSATYRDGYRAHGLLTIFGQDAVKKARHVADALFCRLRGQGVSFRETLVECLGTGASVHGLVSRMSDTHLIETVLRLSVSAETKDPVERFTREIASLVTSGPQGVTGYATGRPKVLPVYGYWPCLIDRSLVTPSVGLYPRITPTNANHKGEFGPIREIRGRLG